MATNDDPPLEFKPIEISAEDARFLEARRYQAEQITRELAIPPGGFLVSDPPYGLETEQLRDAPWNRRRVGFDLASGPDLSAFRWYIGNGGRVGIRMVTEGFDKFARSLEGLGLALRGADRAFERFWWATLTPAQRRRHGKRLVREEIARRRIAKATR